MAYDGDCSSVSTAGMGCSIFSLLINSVKQTAKRVAPTNPHATPFKNLSFMSEFLLCAFDDLWEIKINRRIGPHLPFD